jgi:cell division inhibitor SulA
MTNPSAPPVQTLLSHPDVWRAGYVGAAAPGIATGYPELDDLLADRGWPNAGLIELLAARTGIGELRLLGPALARLSREQRWIVWVNPPHIPYAPALAALGLDVGKVLLVHPRNHDETLWAVEQALKSGTSSAVLAWLDETKLTATDIRRLKLAAKRGATLAVLFRPQIAACCPSTAELRILLHADTATDGLNLEILKRRGGWPVGRFSLYLRDRIANTTRTELREHLSLWRSRWPWHKRNAGAGAPLTRHDH